MRILGYFFIILGLVWAYAMVGGVFSHKFLTLSELWVGFAFHGVCMALGIYFIGRGVKFKSLPE